MTIAVPLGYRLAGVHCGIKRNPNNNDLTLIVSELPAVGGGRVYAEPGVCRAGELEPQAARRASDDAR